MKEKNDARKKCLNKETRKNREEYEEKRKIATKLCTKADRKVRFPYLLKINSNIYFQNQIHNMKT